MKTIDVNLWHNRLSNPDAIRAEINGPKGKGSKEERAREEEDERKRKRKRKSAIEQK